MEAREFVRAILDDPDDDFPRLVFADWLEEAGQVDHAEWVRASCELARLPTALFLGGVHAMALTERVESAWARARPAWWDLRPYADVGMDASRGLIRLNAASRLGAVRLGKVRWLSQAFDQGWLGGLTVSDTRGSDVARAVASWSGTARDIPFHLDRTCHQLSDVGLAAFLDVPNLWSINLGPFVVRLPSASRLGHRTDLRELGLDLRSIQPDRCAAMIDQVGRLVGLRRLELAWYNLHCGGEDLAFLDGLVDLRHLALESYRKLTREALARIGRLPSLRRLTLRGHDGTHPRVLKRIRQFLPALTVEGINFPRS